ncbi:thiol-disulfide oxidoreductase ResA [Aeribacillus pallidus]|jgi:peroxiredoxin|uniref:thiol-disulfide oxidoreductase ResA n=1 Tax=Aeribacillus pallidus TaxID=33936 RepID=UPI001DD6BFE9|nr:thiol-disulfide oxidoreductase ResA [Bacillus sp. (in: firmicutes)]
MKKQRLMIRTIILALLAAVVIYTLYANMSKEDQAIVEKGDQAPDFVLQDLEGNSYQLSDFKGQGVFLNFWGTWCKPCEKEMPYMNNQYKKYKDLGVEILAINVGESAFTINKFVEKHQLEFPILVDKDKKVLDRYGVIPLPTTFLIDKNGKVVEVITGTMSEQDVIRYMETIKP